MKKTAVTLSTMKEDLKREHGFTSKQAEAIAKTMLNTMRTGILEGRNVRLEGVGTIKPKVLAARKGINPQTLEELPDKIPERNTIKLTINQALYDELNPHVVSEKKKKGKSEE